MEDVEESGMCSTEQLSPEEERLIIRDIVLEAQSHPTEGDAFYLMTQRWWQHWLDYVNQDDLEYHEFAATSSTTSIRKPTSIDNTDLIYDSAPEESSMTMELHDTLVEGRDYILLPQDVWKQLYVWYGGGPTLVRKVINSGLSQTELAVEVYLLRLQLLVMSKGETATIRISKKETVRSLHKKACEIFEFNLDQVCIWDYYDHKKYALMNDMDKTLDDANLQMDQDILVEVLGDDVVTGRCLNSVRENGFAQKDSNRYVEACKGSLSGQPTTKGVSRSCNVELTQSQYLASPVAEGDSSYGISGVSTRGSTGGLTGLLNLGNTCFMNSAIQCLVHTPEFARYFREDYHPEINWQNPLGMVGELALAFGELLRKLWAPGRSPIAPRPFKTKLARFAPQFSGYNQHDSQELLAFLLDGLHEDLNRVKHKPYVKSRDADGRPDEEVANEYWANYIARNDSIIVDVCQGQYKSTLVCPVCGKISVTFDPFMWLSLPLQSTNTRTMTVTVFSSDGSVLPTPCTVSVPKHGRCRDLVQAISSACSLQNGEKLLIAEIRGHLVTRFLEDPVMLLSTIKDDDHIAVYKIPKLEKNTVFLQLIHRREEKDSSGAVVWKPYGTPLVSPMSRDDIITRGHVQSIVHTMLSPMLRTEGTSDLNSSMSGAASHADHEVGSSEAFTDSTALDSGDKVHNIPKVVQATSLPLQLVDENNECIDISLGEEETIKLPSSSTSILVYIDWSQKLLEKYDNHHLENVPEVLKYGPPSKKARTEPLSLYTCLEAFLREEPLVPEDMWFCPKCKEQRQASKKLDLWRLPEVLVIHLKRFSYNRSMKHKLETYVNFPIHDLDLTNYVAHNKNSKRQLYELYALSNHYGGMGSGHYTAYIKGCTFDLYNLTGIHKNLMPLLDENRWYNFDDSHVSSINEEDVKSAAAYVLFYRRVKSEHVSVSNGAQSCSGQNHILSPK
ncbi:hypothetical protein IFM89_012486 [Coptis chinensis]|uniref:Ubiquitin carboxyl-terminal hydrolase n=1 Tax=Coptis chinensis TaxID=261450 RepID=A0A835I0G5_9MAGN|nr:hypothetical protein IFM89_012486 [Coptis chinensis]